MSKKSLSMIISVSLALVLVLAMSIGGCAPKASPTPGPKKTPVSPAPKKVVWQGQSAYASGLPLLYTCATHFADKVKELSAGRMEIKMSPHGTIVPALKVLEAVDAGTLDVGCAWGGYWMGKHPAAALFGNSYPGGFQVLEGLSWIYEGGGLELWNELYQKELGLNVKVLPTYGLIGPEDFLWSHKPIKSVEDLKGLKIRTVGIWGECLEKLGAKVVTLPGSEVYPSLERGVIDAAEFATPAINKKLGFDEICEYVKFGGFHEPYAPLETLVNKDSWENLPDDLKPVVKTALRDTTLWALNKYVVMDAKADVYFMEKEGLHTSRLTDEMMMKMKEVGDEVLNKHAEENAFFAKVLKSQREFRKGVEPYLSVNRLPYLYAE